MTSLCMGASQPENSWISQVRRNSRTAGQNVALLSHLTRTPGELERSGTHAPPEETGGQLITLMPH